MLQHNELHSLKSGGNRKKGLLTEVSSSVEDRFLHLKQEFYQPATILPKKKLLPKIWLPKFTGKNSTTQI